MKAIRWACGALAPLVAGLTVLLIVPPVVPGDDGGPRPMESCDHPCTHVDDCPKVSCECDHGTASDVAVCDTEQTHCCGSAHAACTRFCEVNHQHWTGRFSPDTPHDAPTVAEGERPGSSSSACDEPCKDAKDCHTISCQCAHGTAANVAACDVKAHCCGSARIVCEHFCDKKKGKWTGNVVEDAARGQGSGLGGPADAGGDDFYDDDADTEP